MDEKPATRPSANFRVPTTHRNLEWRLGFLSALPCDPELNLYFRFDVRLEVRSGDRWNSANRHHLCQKHFPADCSYGRYQMVKQRLN